jgi:thiamine pyrophosphokinase
MKCIIISAGPELAEEELKKEWQQGAFIICADGGYDNAKKLGIQPHLLLGDLDSIQEDTGALENTPTLVYPREKDDTDTVAAVKEALKRGFDEVHLYGATGGRLDHCMGNIACLSYLHNRGAKGVMVYPWGTIQVIEHHHVLSNMEGTTISILPAEGECKGVTLRGMHYPLDDYHMKWEFPIGISNVVESDQAEILIREGTALLFIDHRI